MSSEKTTLSPNEINEDNLWKKFMETGKHQVKPALRNRRKKKMSHMVSNTQRRAIYGGES